MFTRILLAVDSSDAGPVAVSYASALASSGAATVRAVHVNEFLVGGRGFTAETEREAMQVVDEAVAALRSAGVEADGVHYLANCFTVPNRIVDAAHEWGADVIVLGSTRRRFRRLVGKGLRERVTAMTSLPIVTAPAPFGAAGLRLTADAMASLAQLEAPVSAK
jgi:nucleotide-binding universal stress UspA family protein